jgi:hypothetical protein
MRGQSVKGKDALKDLLDDWHLDLSTGQYRRSSGGKPPGRALKLVYHVVLSMPAPTPREKVLAAADKFGREKFGIEHRYAMVLHLCGAGVYVERPSPPSAGGTQQGSHST